MGRIISALIACAACALPACGGNPMTPQPPPPPAEQLRISCPDPIERESLSGQPLAVEYSAPTTTGGRSPVTATCAPQSGAEFPVGSTSVLCTAQDSSSQTQACSFTVVVKGTPKLSLTRFVAFGDSITFGVDAPELFRLLVDVPDSYPAKLEPQLQDRYRTQTIFVGNDGLPGEHAYDAAQRRFASMLRIERPEAVLLLEGANDLINYEDRAFDRAIPALDRMVSDAQTAGAKVFLATLTPMRSGGARRRDRVAALIPSFNEDVKGIAAARAGTVLVDLEPVFLKDMSLIGADDLHPTTRGYQVMAETFFEAIRKALEVQAPAPSAVPLSAAPSRDATFPFRAPRGSRPRR